MSIMANSSTIHTSKKRKHVEDTPQAPRKSRRTSDDTPIATTDDADSNADTSARPLTKHTKKERKQNRSTRIHSLRKQLARGNLPSTIKQERERELASLLHEQEKTKTKQQSRKTLEKYHYVRFVERQKAEKKLRQLRKQLDADDNAEDDTDKIKAKIHEMEVSRNYAIYAPLYEKYISVFAPSTDKKASKSASSKPPMWHKIEAAMSRGQSALEAIRDSKMTGKANPPIGSKTEEDRVRPSNAETKPKDKASTTTNTSAHRNEAAVGGRADEASDDESDGGFFER